MTEFSAPGTLAPVLSDIWDKDGSWKIETYRANGGYEALAKAWTFGDGELTQVAKDAGLAGRGGRRRAVRRARSRHDLRAELL